MNVRETLEELGEVGEQIAGGLVLLADHPGGVDEPLDALDLVAIAHHHNRRLAMAVVFVVLAVRVESLGGRARVRQQVGVLVAVFAVGSRARLEEVRDEHVHEAALADQADRWRRRQFRVCCCCCCCCRLPVHFVDVGDVARVEHVLGEHGVEAGVQLGPAHGRASGGRIERQAEGRDVVGLVAHRRQLDLLRQAHGHERGRVEAARVRAVRLSSVLAGASIVDRTQQHLGVQIRVLTSCR